MSNYRIINYRITHYSLSNFLAERGGFEPPDPKWDQRFSRPPHSTALPSLRSGMRLVFLRRERDSNPRTLAGQRFSRPPQSTALPSLRRQKYYFFENYKSRWPIGIGHQELDAGCWMLDVWAMRFERIVCGLPNY